MPTKVELESEIATLKAQLAARPSPDGSQVSQTEGQKLQDHNPALWERWIRGIGVGVFLLAAIGIIFYALTIRKIEPSFTNLRPFIVGIFITAVLLLILDFGTHQLKELKRVQWFAKYLGIGFAILFILVALVVVSWLAIFILQDSGVMKSGRSFPSGHPAQLLFDEADRVKNAPFVRRNLKWSMTFHSVEIINNIPHGHYDLSHEYEIWNISSDSVSHYPLVHQFEVPRSEKRDSISGSILIKNPRELGAFSPTMICQRKPGTQSFVFKHEIPVPVGETRTVKIEVKSLVCVLPYSDYFVGRWPSDSMELDVNLQNVQMDGDMVLLRDNVNANPVKDPRPDGSAKRITLTVSGAFLSYQGIYCTLYPVP